MIPYTEKTDFMESHGKFKNPCIVRVCSLNPCPKEFNHGYSQRTQVCCSPAIHHCIEIRAYLTTLLPLPYEGQVTFLQPRGIFRP